MQYAMSEWRAFIDGLSTPTAAAATAAAQAQAQAQARGDRMALNPFAIPRELTPLRHPWHHHDPDPPGAQGQGGDSATPAAEP
jgi:hypothetical protein